MGDRDADDDLVRPTEPMAPLFADELLLDAAAIEHRAAGRGDREHAVLVSRDDLAPVIEEIAVRDSGSATPVMTSDAQQPIAREELRLRASLPGIEVRPLTFRTGAPIGVDDSATAPRVQTSLGVAPLEPATTVRAPFVIDTPVAGSSRLPRAASPRASSPALGHRLPSEPPRWTGELPPGARPERTAMIALDPSSGMPRAGITRKALANLARRVRSVRWWMARRRRTDVIRRRR